jgi:hypothetical protein
MDVKQLKKLLSLQDDESDWFEMFIHECNREGLISAQLEYNSEHQHLYFSPEAQVADNLVNFGNKLSTVF